MATGLGLLSFGGYETYKLALEPVGSSHNRFPSIDLMSLQPSTLEEKIPAPSSLPELKEVSALEKTETDTTLPTVLEPLTQEIQPETIFTDREPVQTTITTSKVDTVKKPKKSSKVNSTNSTCVTTSSNNNGTGHFT